VDDDLLRALASLCATRRFSSRPIDPADIDRIMEVARWTGSARNRQPWRLITLETSSELTALSRLGAYAQHVRDCPLAVLIAIDRESGGADAEFDAGRLVQNVMLAAHAPGLGYRAGGCRPSACEGGPKGGWRPRSRCGRRCCSP